MRTWLAFCTVALTCACSGGGGGSGTLPTNPPPPPPPPVSLTITVGADSGYGAENLFAPATLTVKVGDTVTWVWAGAGHSVDSGSECTFDGKFTSNGVQEAGFRMSHTFASAGTYPYYCANHCGLKMVGTVIVQ